MSKRTIWQAPGGNVTEPSDKEWNEDELVAAEHLNWFFEQVEADIDDLNDLAHIGSSEPTKNLKQLIVGSSGLYRGGTDEGGVALYTAFNAKWTGSDWEEIDDTKSEPALFAYYVTDVSKLNGISSGDIGPNNFIVLYASSVNNSNVITWNTAPQVVNTLLFSDSDGDGNRWGFNEQVDGDLHLSHPDRANDYIFNEGGPTNDEDVVDKQYVDQRPLVANANFFDSPVLITSTNGNSTSGTIDVTANSSFNDQAVALILYAFADENGGSNNPSFVEIKFPGHSNWKRIAEARGDVDVGDTNDKDSNSITYGLENGQLDYELVSPNGLCDLFVYAEIV